MLPSSHMIEVKITEEMIAKAQQSAEEMGKLRNSIRKGEGNLVGFIGEQVAHQVLGGFIDNTYDHDIVLDDFMTTVDVKTKETTCAPKPYYSCSVADYNTKQKCDYYAFVRVKKDLSVGWYLGVYPKQSYVKDAVFLKAGDFDPDNNFTVKSDCYNIPISKLSCGMNFR